MAMVSSSSQVFRLDDDPAKGAAVVNTCLKSALFGLLLLGSTFAQDVSPVEIAAEIRPGAIKRGSTGVFEITCKVAQGYHISDASEGFFKVETESADGVTYLEVEYPPGKEDSYYGTIYRGTVRVPVPFIVTAGAEEGVRRLNARVSVQACWEESGLCYPPRIMEVGSEFRILPEKKGRTVNRESDSGPIADRLSRALERGSWIAFFIVFLGGLLTSFTPCVYPMIPITIAVIGAQASGGKLKGLFLSLFYVLGIAITFSTLGVIAAKTGGIFGSYAQHPIVLTAISAIFLLMGLSMLGVFVIQMPARLATKLRGKKRTGFIGAFLTGLVAGLIVSPCISPLLVVILAWVAKTGSVILGAGLLFSFALGLGVLFVIIGTFSGVLKNLPKAGGWMVIIERSFGILLVIIALVFIRRVLSLPVYLWSWAVFFILAGTFIGAFSPLDADSEGKKKLMKAAGLISIIVGACLIFFGFQRFFEREPQAPSERAAVEKVDAGWIPSDAEGFRVSRGSGKPVLMDFYADWCTACKELDEKVWPDARVKAQLENYVLVKLDLTKNDDRAREFQRKYRIVGMPTVILFHPSGEEKFRLEGYAPPEDMEKLLIQYGREGDADEASL